MDDERKVGFPEALEMLRTLLSLQSDLMEALSYDNFGGRLTLDEAAALLSLPSKLGEHGSEVASMAADGDIGRIRNYCETDTFNLFGACVRWAASTGRIDAAGHDLAIGTTIACLEAQRSARPHLGRLLDARIAAAGERTPFMIRPAPAGPRGVACSGAAALAVP